MKKQGNQNILYHENRKTSQGYVNLQKLSEVELKELLERQDKLLNNKSFISKLPDKGSKIVSFRAEIKNEIKNRQQELDSACHLLANLNINNSNAEDIEWNEGRTPENKKELDSDDDSDENVDPLKLIATHSGTTQKSKKKRLPPEPSLITENDLKDVKEFSYEAQLCEKYGQVTNVKERFRPNHMKEHSTNKLVTSAENVKKRLGSKWEVTEATPPVPVYKDTKMISLSESLLLQKQQAERLKEIEKQHAMEKLKSLNVKMGNKLPVKNITEYRSVRDVFEETANESEEEVQEDDKGGVVFYNLIDEAPEPS